MCGISIAINKSKDGVEAEFIKSMNNAIIHRGPDTEGFYYDKNFAFGHRRLSIIDLTDAGNQPMESNNLIITYNGEVYNYIELKEELTKLGYTFCSATDTEVILTAYAHWDVSCFEKFNGMWALAIYDKAKNNIVFCRDHFGIKPLYYFNSEKYFLAGSEIKQFCQIEDFIPKLNTKTAINFLANGILNYSNQTFFQDVLELKPGHYLTYNLADNSFNEFEWYSLEKACIRSNHDEINATNNVRQLFTNSLRLRMRADVKVGSCLSGGIDSTAIVTTVFTANLGNPDFATITSCYADTKYDEQYFSDLVTDKTNFKALKVFPQLNELYTLGYLDKMIYHQDQPILSASHFSEFSVFKIAKENDLIVMLDGQGSDEYFCGYSEFYTTKLLELLKKGKFNTAHELVNLKAIHKKSSSIQEWIAVLKSIVIYPVLNRIKSFIPNKNKSIFNHTWKQILAENKVIFKAKTIRELSLEEIKYSSLPYQLHSEDRNSMLFSIESRLPFLCPRLVEYVVGLPDQYKINNGYSKHILRKAIPEMPKEILERKDKMGFVAPDASWLIENNALIRAELEDAVNKTGIFTTQLVEQFDAFVEGKRNYNPVFFRVLTFNRFCRLFKIKTV